MKGAVTIVCLVALAFVVLAAPDQRFPKTGKEWTPRSLINPDELGDYFEGDIELPLLPLDRNGIIDENFRWPGGRVSYEFDSNYSPANKARVRRAMDEFQILTSNCTAFHERLNEGDYILFTHNNSMPCYSSVGKRGGMQIINYPQWCLNSFGTTLHEMFHSLGFHHEHSRYDRDNYVTIMWDNIEPGKNENFNKYSKKDISGFGESYDYGSIMHYSAYAFTSNGKKTIVPKDPEAHIGQRDSLSVIDLRKLRKMYSC